MILSKNLHLYILFYHILFHYFRRCLKLFVQSDMQFFHHLQMNLVQNLHHRSLNYSKIPLSHQAHHYEIILNILTHLQIQVCHDHFSYLSSILHHRYQSLPLFHILTFYLHAMNLYKFFHLCNRKYLLLVFFLWPFALRISDYLGRYKYLPHYINHASIRPYKQILQVINIFLFLISNEIHQFRLDKFNFHCIIFRIYFLKIRHHFRRCNLQEKIILYFFSLLIILLQLHLYLQILI